MFDDVDVKSSDTSTTEANEPFLFYHLGMTLTRVTRTHTHTTTHTKGQQYTRKPTHVQTGEHDHTKLNMPLPT